MQTNYIQDRGYCSDMVNIGNWMLVEMVLYYSLIFSAVFFLLVDFFSKVDIKQDEGELPHSADADHMDLHYKMAQYFQLFFCVISSGIFVLHIDWDNECTGD